MKNFGLCVLLICSWVLAFYAGQRFPQAPSSEKLEVVFVDDEGPPGVSGERQVLALIAADPLEDAEVAFWAKDVRLVGFPGAGHSPSEIKMLPFGDYIRHPSQEKALRLAGEYADAYNKRMKELTEWDEDIRRAKPEDMAPSRSK